jgi:hypothetical protein
MLFLIIQILASKKNKEKKNINLLVDSNTPTCGTNTPENNLAGCKQAYLNVVSLLPSTKKKILLRKNNTYHKKIKGRSIEFRLGTILEEFNEFVALCVKTACTGDSDGCNAIIATGIAEGGLGAALKAADFATKCATGEDPTPDVEPDPDDPVVDEESSSEENDPQGGGQQGDDQKKEDNGIFTLKANAFLALICFSIANFYFQI